MPPMRPSPSPTPSPSRLRRHAATLVLVVACLGTVATSPPRSPPATATIGSTLRLTQDTPRSTRGFVIRVSARDSSEDVRGEVNGLLTARWMPAGPTTSPAPTLRARLARVDDTQETGRTFTLDTPGASQEWYAGSAYFDTCTLKKGCELEVELDFEAQGELGEGTVEVDWKVNAEAYTFTDDAPKGFTVEIQER